MKRIFAVLVSLCLSGSVAQAIECFAGDSLANGMGISYCATLPPAAQTKCRALNVAKDGARTIALLDQLKRCPDGAVVRVSAGTNDAVDRNNSLYTFAERYETIVARVMAAADARGQILIWYAPPRVPFTWDAFSQIAANKLHIMLEGSGHRYVETRNIEWGRLRAADGIHFSIPHGYLALYRAGRI